MLTKWLKSRSPRSPQSNRFFRPELEALEGRLAPSNIVPFVGPGHGNGHGNGNGNGNGKGNGGGDPSPAPIAGPVVNQSGNVHNNIHISGSFNNNTGSFNNVVGVAGAGLLGPSQVGAIGALFALSSLLAAETSNTSVGTLVDDEIALAVDNYINGLLPGTISSTDISNLTTAISGLESGLPFIGPVLGSLAYNVTFDALKMAQPTI
jgi:hypothetical protein